VGELLKELARAEPEDRNPAGRAGTSSDDATKLPASPYAAALADNNISRQAASNDQALADMPARVFSMG
jgi:hypothetical protein